MSLNNHGVCPLIRVSGTQNLGLQALRKGTNLKSLNLNNPPYNSLLGIWTIAHVEDLSFSCFEQGLMSQTQGLAGALES